ncbi:hypothetical protein BpHYR1_045638 [Brachionus plicatilis]|uniref:Uncharacterized protein n=1 Tax=Brachionus plicatilis TaxID=10195 RepID=A0A3M7QGN7_BRAPC|nr:hypothetical protein BpHYR1_045638 [Brachionus plicatilis]
MCKDAKRLLNTIAIFPPAESPPNMSLLKSTSSCCQFSKTCSTTLQQSLIEIGKGNSGASRHLVIYFCFYLMEMMAIRVSLAILDRKRSFTRVSHKKSSAVRKLHLLMIIAN